MTDTTGLAEMHDVVAAEIADLRADLDAKDVLIAELEANINTKADWIEATINDMAADAEKMAAKDAEIEALRKALLGPGPSPYIGGQAGHSADGANDEDHD